MYLSIVIVNHNTRNLLLGCLAAVFDTVEGVEFDVWLVDNGSDDGSVAAARELYPSIRTIENQKNVGLSTAYNQALRHSESRFVLFLHTDATPGRGAVKALCEVMEVYTDAAMACGQLLNLDGSKQAPFQGLPSILTVLFYETFLNLFSPKKFPGREQQYINPVEVQSVMGACVIVRRATIDMVGLLDERYFFYMEMEDLARRVRTAGWKVYFEPTAHIFHLHGQSVGGGLQSQLLFYQSSYRYFRKWQGLFCVGTFLIIILKMVARLAATLIGTVVTLGQYEVLRRSLVVQCKLVLWHLCGCPKDWLQAGGRSRWRLRLRRRS